MPEAHEAPGAGVRGRPNAPSPMASTKGERDDLLTFDESVELVERMLGGAITPTIFWLHGPEPDGSYEARLTVDPAVAFAALQARESARA